MSIETADKLKAQLTDKYVIVKHGIAELKRFESLTGVVKTVNMSGRALVQFDGPVDIGWYDIDPQYLSVVEAPAKKAAPDKHAGAKEGPAKSAAPVAAAKPAAAAAGAAAKPAGMSPLEMARAQGAGAKAPAAAGTAPAAEKKLSPLEMARQQGALKAGSAALPKPAAPAKAEGAPTTAPQAAPAASPAQPGKKMSPLEIARMQDAGKEGCLSTPAPVASAAAPAAPTPAAATPSAPAPAAPAPAPGKKLSPLELARQQGAFKG